ncbi:hypothetical protein [Larkinella sp. C7]|uniref:hypothetical protein n=1 Tax=Larkinella sp. C7 TaxID=2576607 RepID=UPI0011111193|nr:hypothetical protein [Larkinella sp. C7]
MKYLVLFLSLLSYPLYSQSNGVGLGPFRIGITTPDSLHQPGFQEQELVVVKGTLALACTNMRVFKADAVELQGITIAALFLVFHENRLYRITCEFDEPLQTAFVAQHGKGQKRPAKRLALCDQSNAKRLVLESESWQLGDCVALAIRAVGTNARCEPEQTSRLTIASPSVASITSECDLDHLDPYFEGIGVKR